MALLSLDLTSSWFHHVVVVVVVVVVIVVVVVVVAAVSKYRKLQDGRGQIIARLIQNIIKIFPAFPELEILISHTFRQTDRQKCRYTL